MKEYPGVPMLLAFDGDVNQIKLLESGVLDTTYPDNGIMLLKLSENCSLSQQPADVGPGFRRSKELLKKIFEKNLWPAEDQPPYINLIEPVLQKLESDSRETFRTFFKCLQYITSEGFTSYKCMRGFLESGMVPYDKEKMMNKWAGFRFLAQDHRESLLACMDPLIQYAKTDELVTKSL